MEVIAMRMLAAVALLAAAMPLVAQRDFLTAEEIEMVREAQEPNERLKLYIKFADDRLALLKHLFAAEKAGRSALVHATLESYTKIIEAIDTVSDDALKRHVDIEPGVRAVAAAEKKMLATLEAFGQTPAKDRSRYDFALKTALDTTRDSLDMSLEDPGQRRAGVAAKDQRDRAEREAALRPEEIKEKRATEKKETEAKRKVPTLRRKGETAPAKP
ncbi:MAG: hypothetical protein M1541_09075 [Acidobacteria bacterium]|nr:hypothetical protein [Acidobacteriota bacterium]